MRNLIRRDGALTLAAANRRSASTRRPDGGGQLRQDVIQSLLYTLAVALLGALALTCSGCRWAKEKPLHVVCAKNRVLMVESRHPVRVKTYDIAPDAEIIKNGRAAALDDLKPGDEVQVKTEWQGRNVVAKTIAAVSGLRHRALMQAAR